MLKAPELLEKATQRGFTLIELVIGIVVLSIALLVITKSLGPLYERSADPWHQVRAAELGQSFLNEIMARSYDEMSDKAGGEYRCRHDSTSVYEIGASDCTAEPSLAAPIACIDRQPAVACSTGLSCWGPEPDENPALTGSFDDVDDFHGLAIAGDQLVNIVNASLAADYKSYKICVDVRYAGTDLGTQLDNRSAKKITVSVVTPAKEQIDFAAYRSNW